MSREIVKFMSFYNQSPFRQLIKLNVHVFDPETQFNIPNPKLRIHYYRLLYNNANDFDLNNRFVEIRDIQNSPFRYLIMDVDHPSHYHFKISKMTHSFSYFDLSLEESEQKFNHFFNIDNISKDERIQSSWKRGIKRSIERDYEELNVHLTAQGASIQSYPATPQHNTISQENQALDKSDFNTQTTFYPKTKIFSFNHTLEMDNLRYNLLIQNYTQNQQNNLVPVQVHFKLLNLQAKYEIKECSSRLMAQCSFEGSSQVFQIRDLSSSIIYKGLQFENRIIIQVPKPATYYLIFHTSSVSNVYKIHLFTKTVNSYDLETKLSLQVDQKDDEEETSLKKQEYFNEKEMKTGELNEDQQTNSLKQDYIKTFQPIRKRAINLFFQISGSMYEAMLLIFLQQIREYNPNENFRILIVQGIYLNPDFEKKFIRLCNILNFEYELLNFAWSEDIMSADFLTLRNFIYYRILFLDQLFLNYKNLEDPIDRVIFMDADQALASNQTDLRKLFEVDLQGKVYGFVSHCRLMETYFISEYWKKLLSERGLHYYFGGIFVADIRRFQEEQSISSFIRKLYMRFTQQEEQENLALMDQDLINFVQLSIPIHTLDSQWLWCEAWCDAEDWQEGKVAIVDFCTDPLRLWESKIQRAMRIIPDYKQLYLKVMKTLQ